MELLLSNRLAAAAAYLPVGCFAADIGCDHGKLAAWLVLSGRCRQVEASDLREGPLSRARELFESLGIADRCRAVLGDGFAAVSPDIEAAVIAGMGAETTAHILSSCDWIADPAKTLVLVPASRHGELRRWLAQNGWIVTGETAVAEAGHCYAVMQARYTGGQRELSDLEAALGLLAGDPSPDAVAYRLAEHRRVVRALNGERAAARSDEARIEQLAALERAIGALL